MEIGKVTVWGIEVHTVRNITIRAGLNQHAQMELECLVRAEKVQELIGKAAQKAKIVVKEGEQVLFCGPMTGVDCTMHQQYAQAHVIAQSSSCLLDGEKHTRSYQDTTKTYQNIAESKVPCIFYGKESPIDDILLQYQETDWEFLKRMASKCQTYLYPDMTANHSRIYWGMDKQRTGKEIHVLEAEITKALDVVTYQLESDAFFQVGDAIIYQGKRLYICQLECKMEQADFRAVYSAKPIEAIKCPAQYLYDMAGTALEGTIIDVAGDKVKVHLRVDEVQDVQSAYWFPFSTMQSAADGSGWYYMPEIGDCVKVCIPGWEEKGAFAVSAVSTYQAEAGSEDKMGDTNVKYMRNPSGKEVQLTPEGIKADGGGKASFLSMTMDGNIVMESRKTLQISASETIEIIAGEGIEMQAAEIIDIKADTSGELLLNEAGEIRQLGGQVNINSEE